MPSAKYFHYDVRVCTVSFSTVGGVFFLLVLQRYSKTCLSLNRSRLSDETKSVPFILKAVVSHQL